MFNLVYIDALRYVDPQVLSIDTESNRLLGDIVRYSGWLDQHHPWPPGGRRGNTSFVCYEMSR
jgi:hypothetical protein